MHLTPEGLSGGAAGVSRQAATAFNGNGCGASSLSLLSLLLLLLAREAGGATAAWSRVGRCCRHYGHDVGWVGVGVGVDAITAANDDINYTKNQVSHCQRVRRVHTLDKAIVAG